jgi:ABC-2 type transport system ATP-binding protein
MIEAVHLCKSFGPLLAVDDVSFSVRRGEVLGFLGPNGAGKTTAMRMLTGFLAPGAGTARICGADITRDPIAAQRRIGYLPEGAPAWGEMTPAGFLHFIACIRGFAGAEARRRIALAVERAGLGDVLSRPIDTLSKGFRRRVGLAQALLHDPEVLILDEPTDGLDPNQKHDIRRLITVLAPRKAIVISTHLLEEVDAICTRTVVIVRGRLRADGTPAELRARSRLHNAVRLAIAEEHAAAARDALAGLPQVAAVEQVTDAEGPALLVLPRDGAPILAEVAELVRAQGWRLGGIRAERGRLDDVFRDISTTTTLH